jgi:DNA-binding MarR family transcriptional regulator
MLAHRHDPGSVEPVVIKKSATITEATAHPPNIGRGYVEGVPAPRIDQPDETTLSPLFYLFTATQRAHALLARAMADSPLRSDEYAAYSVILEVGPITPTDFARSMGLPLTTALDHIRSMLRRGHVAKVRNPRDQRSYLIELTKDGRAVHRAANRHFAPAGDRLLAILGESRSDVSRALLALMNAAEQALNEFEGAETEATG